MTQKGKGHSPAEEDPIKYHGVSPKKAPPKEPMPIPLPTFSQVFGKTDLNQKGEFALFHSTQLKIWYGTNINAYARGCLLLRIPNEIL